MKKAPEKLAAKAAARDLKVTIAELRAETSPSETRGPEWKDFWWAERAAALLEAYDERGGELESHKQQLVEVRNQLALLKIAATEYMTATSAASMPTRNATEAAEVIKRWQHAEERLKTIAGGAIFVARGGN